MSNANGGNVRVMQLDGKKGELLAKLLGAAGLSDNSGDGDGAAEGAERDPKALMEAMLDKLLRPCDCPGHAPLYEGLRKVLGALYNWELVPEGVRDALQTAMIGQALHADEDPAKGIARVIQPGMVASTIMLAMVALRAAGAVPGGAAVPAAKADGFGVYL